MSNLSAALAAALQNNDAIAALISGVISDEDFKLQDEKLATTPFACLKVGDLPSQETPYLGSASGKVSGQIEIRCISAISKAKVSELEEAVKAYLRPISSLPWDGGTIPFGITGWQTDYDTFEDLSAWIAKITINFKAAA